MSTGAFIEILSDIEQVVGKSLAPSLLARALNRATTMAGVDARGWLIKPVGNSRCPVSKGFEFKDKGKIGNKTGGRLLASLGGRKDGVWTHDNLTYTHTLGSNVVYAEAIISQDGKHSGGPYIIRARYKPFLVFPLGPNKSDIVRTKQVTHPGAKEIGRRKTGKAVALLTQAKDYVEAHGQEYVNNAIEHYMEAFR